MYDIETIRRNIGKKQCTVKELYGLSDEEYKQLREEIGGKLNKLSKMYFTQREMSLALLEDYLDIKEVTAKQLLEFHFLFDQIESHEFPV